MLEIKVNENKPFEITHEDGGWLINGTPANLDIRTQPNGLISILYNGKSYTATVEKTDFKNKEIAVRIDGQIYKAAIKEPIDQLLNKMGLDLKAAEKVAPIKAPMPGMVLKILVQPGQQIKKGDGILILEAMKMENLLKAGADATVKSIKVNERMAVEKGAVLIELE